MFIYLKTVWGGVPRVMQYKHMFCCYSFESQKMKLKEYYKVGSNCGKVDSRN